jgi:hypothetical protein
MSIDVYAARERVISEPADERGSLLASIGEGAATALTVAFAAFAVVGVSVVTVLLSLA